MDSEHKEEIIANICSYAEKHAVKEMLHEYMKRLSIHSSLTYICIVYSLCFFVCFRVIINKPENVVQFLIDTIEKDPFVAPAKAEE